jgi:hypothetical protein
MKRGMGVVAGSRRRTGFAAVMAGLFIFAGQGGQLVFGSPSRLVDVLFVVLGGIGLIALGVAVWGLRGLVSGSRRGRVGWWLGIAGTGVLGLFAVQAGVSMVRTGEVPQNFVLFLVGFLLLVVGQVLFARDLRHHLGWAWILPLVAAVGLICCAHGHGRPRPDPRHRVVHLRGGMGGARCGTAEPRAPTCA